MRHDLSKLVASLIQVGQCEQTPGGGGLLARSLGTHCEPEPKSGESGERQGAVTAPYP